MDKPHVDFNVNVSDLHQKSGKVIPLTSPGQGDDFEGIIDIIDKKAFANGFKAEEVPIPEIRVAEVEAAYDEIVELIAMTDETPS